MPRGTKIVIDLGKTLSKVSLWDSEANMLDRVVCPNAPIIVDGVKRIDVERTREWVLEVLSTFSNHPVETIVPVGHGAAVVALLDERAAFPPLDYEQAIPADVLADYRAARDDFAITGSPDLPDGLNLGAQLFWLERLHPDAMRHATLVPWAQYWSWVLTGTAVSEVSSLGCHSDLWAPFLCDYSPLARKMGWSERFAPVVGANEVVGTLSDDVALITGLPRSVEVLAGLHDSNAALHAARGFDQISDREATVLSTGTWFIAMRLSDNTGSTPALPEARDCLVNVDVAGRPVPSSRFMGGREIESVIEIDTRRVDIKPDQPRLLAAVPQVLKARAMMRPTLAPGTGPFPRAEGGWVNEPDDWFQRRAAMCLYAALVADVSLNLIGSVEQVLIEGRFAEAEVFVRALASLRPHSAIYTANAHNDVSFGALRLIDHTLKPQGTLLRALPLDVDLAAYRDQWHADIGALA